MIEKTSQKIYNFMSGYIHIDTEFEDVYRYGIEITLKNPFYKPVFGGYAECTAYPTIYLPSSFWWDSVSNAEGTTEAYLRINRTDGSNTTLGGSVVSQSRTWK